MNNQNHPGENWHPEHRHTGSTHIDNRDDEVDSSDKRGDTCYLQSKGIKVHASARAERDARIWGVGEPTTIWSTAQEPTEIQENPTKNKDP